MIRSTTQSERREQTGVGVTAGYIRLTREESILTGLSVPAQRDGITSYAQQRELPNLTIYLEERAVGADVPFEKRQAGRRLIADIRAGTVRHIICRDVDRLSRDTILWLKFVELCCEHGVTIHTFSGPLSLKSPSDRFASTVRAAAAQLEKDQVADRVKRAKRELAKQGKPLGGPPPFGYTSRSRRQAELVAGGLSPDQARAKAEQELPRGFVIDPKEAEVVRIILDRYTKTGAGCRAIGRELNNLGFRRRSGRLWHPDKVRRVINDPVIAGMIPYDEELFQTGFGRRKPKSRQAFHKGTHEAIVPLDLWQAAQKIKAARTPTIPMPKVSRTAPLAEVLRCTCGAPMTVRSTGTRHSFFYYICTKRKGYGRGQMGGCDAPTFNSDRLHEAFWTTLVDMLTSGDTVKRVYQAAQEARRGQQKAPRPRPAATAADLTKLERDISLWYARHDEAGGDAEKEAAWRRIVQLTERQKALQAQPREETSVARPGKPVTLEQVRTRLQAIGMLVANASDRGKGLVRSLVEHQGLTVQVVDARTVKVGLALLPPGDAGEPAAVEATIRLSSENKIDEWLREQNARGLTCACGCGRKLEIRRIHYCRGLPEFHRACRHNGMQRKRRQLAEGYLTGDQLAKKLGIGRTTLGRWIRSGKLDKPTKSIGGMLLFD